MSVKKNFIYNISYQILIIIIPLITTPYIARIIGPEGVGIQSYTYSIANYFVLFIMLGVNNHGNRSVAIVRDDKEQLSRTFLSIFSLKAIASLILISIYAIYTYFAAKEYKVFFIIQSIYLISAFLDINWFFFGMEKFKITVIRNTVIKLLTVFCIFIFVKNSNDLYKYSLILAVGSLISQIILWKYVKQYINFIKLKWTDIFVHIKPMMILFIPVIAISIYKIMDKIMIGNMSSVIQVGYYENSEKIINIPVAVIIALGTVMLPKISNLQAQGNEKLIREYIEKSIDYVVFISIGAVFGLIGVSKTLIPIFLGDKFNQCIDIVAILSVTIIFIAWANVIRTQFLIPKKKDKIYIVSTILGSVVNLIINLLLIRTHGAVGAAIGTVFAEATVSIYQTIKVKKELPIGMYIKRNIFYIIPGVIMYFIIRIIGNIFKNNILTGILQIGVGTFIYLLISIAYMIWMKNEMALSIISKITRKSI